MRAIFKHFAWALATVALVIATPIQAAAYHGGSTTPSVVGAAGATTTVRPDAAPNATPNATAPAVTRVAIASALATTTLQQQDSGRGWAELYCMACVGLGALALYSGGITMLPVILGNPAVYGTFTGTCLLACESAIKSLLK